MNNPMSLFAALFLGFMASGHCVLMCGGIAGALGVATGKDAQGRPRRHLLVGYQVGRILSYTMAGLLVGGAGGALIAVLDMDSVRLALRIASAAALLLAALVMLGVFRDPGALLGRRLWPRLAPMGKRLLPVDSLPRALGFGAIWGWMPCGFVYTILLVAALGAEPLQSAGVMAAFGLGTLPAMLATSWGAPGLVRLTSSLGLRRSAGLLLIACAAITLAAPMLVGHAPWLQHWLPFDCS